MGGILVIAFWNMDGYQIGCVQVIHLYKTFVMMKKEDLPKEIRDKKWTSVGGVSQISADDIIHL